MLKIRDTQKEISLTSSSEWAYNPLSDNVNWVFYFNLNIMKEIVITEIASKWRIKP